jgi:replication factor C subunit 1
MDEVDGMGGGDRGGMNELIQLIKKSKTPIICICNDRNSPKVRSLANYCLDLRFARPSAQMIRSRIHEIATKENISIDLNSIDNLVASSQSDIRQILNMLQTFKLSGSSMSYDQSKKLGIESKKNIDLGPFDLASRMLSGTVLRGYSMEDKMQLYFSDYQLLPPFIQENYIRMKPWTKGKKNPIEQELDKLDAIALAAESISDSDMTERLIYGRQEFGLLPVHAMFSCILPATYVIGNMGERLAFPSILGQISKRNKCMRLLKEIHMHMRLHISSDKQEIRLNYMPALIPRLTVPLIKSGSLAIDGVISLMDEYYLSKDDWEAMLELSLGPFALDAVMKKIPTAVKTAFTRKYNKGVHLTPFSLTATSGKLAKVTASAKVQFEEAMDLEEDNEEEEEQDDDIEIDKMVKPKTKAAPKGKPKAGTSKKASTSKKGKNKN